MRKDKLKPSFLNTHRMNYKEIPKAYEMMSKRDKKMLGVIFEWS